MRVQTDRFGAVELPEQSIVRLAGGVVGFEGREEFALYRPEEFAPIGWFMSIDDPSLSFAVIDPEEIVQQPLALNLSPADVARIDLKETDPFQILVILSPADQGTVALTANLRGPLLINGRNRVGKQLLLHGSRIPTRQPLTRTNGRPTHPAARPRRAVVRSGSSRAA